MNSQRFISALPERIQAVQGQLDEIRKGINQRLDAIEKVGFSSSIQGRLAEREEEERKLIAQLVNLEDLIVEPAAITAVSEQQINERVAGIRQALTGDDVELAWKAIQQFVAKVVVSEKAGTIYYTFPLSSLSRLGLMPHRGNEPYPIRRAITEVRIRGENHEKAKLRERVRELRSQGFSYPAIARTLNFSEGTAWNYANR